MANANVVVIGAALLLSLRAMSGIDNLRLLRLRVFLGAGASIAAAFCFVLTMSCCWVYKIKYQLPQGAGATEVQVYSPAA